jgi:hypothetical protein
MSAGVRLADAEPVPMTLLSTFIKLPIQPHIACNQQSKISIS